jgi:hypothetical protein
MGYNELKDMCGTCGFDILSTTINQIWGAPDIYELKLQGKTLENKKGEMNMPPKNYDGSHFTFSFNPSEFATLLPNNNKLGVKSIKYDGKETYVKWNDGTTTRVSCGENEQQSHYSAFCSALAIKIFGTNSQVKKLIEDKDEQIEIDKQQALLEEKERVAAIRKARKDRIWIKKRAKEIVLEQRAQQRAQELLRK